MLLQRVIRMLACLPFQAYLDNIEFAGLANRSAARNALDQSSHRDNTTGTWGDHGWHLGREATLSMFTSQGGSDASVILGTAEASQLLAPSAIQFLNGSASKLCISQNAGASVSGDAGPQKIWNLLINVCTPVNNGPFRHGPKL